MASEHSRLWPGGESALFRLRGELKLRRRRGDEPLDALEGRLFLPRRAVSHVAHISPALENTGPEKIARHLPHAPRPGHPGADRTVRHVVIDIDATDDPFLAVEDSFPGAN